MIIRVDDRRRPSSRQGTVVVWVVLSLTFILGMAALNLDGGRMMEERRRVQATADAAALSAAANLYVNYWSYYGADHGSLASTAAQQSVAVNGYPNASVTVNIPPKSGTFAGQAGYVEVIVSTTLNATFGRLFTGAGLPVSARSVARGLPLQIGLILLRPNGAGAFLNQAAAFALVNKPLIVDSSDPAAFTQAAFGAFVAGRVDITGGYSNPGGAITLARIRTGMRPTPDPLQYLPIPDLTAPTMSGAPLTINSILPTVLQPGIYNGGLHITGVSVVVMLPGVYVMAGGGFRVDGAATVTGLGVMVYNTTSPSFSAGPIQVAGLGKIVMTAPLSGTFQGINFFQNRSLTQPITVTGLGLTTITGVVYAAQAPVVLSGSAAVGLDILGGAYVVDSMTVQGVGAVTINLGLNPPRIPDVRVVE